MWFRQQERVYIFNIFILTSVWNGWFVIHMAGSVFTSLLFFLWKKSAENGDDRGQRHVDGISGALPLHASAARRMGAVRGADRLCGPHRLRGLDAQGSARSADLVILPDGFTFHIMPPSAKLGPWPPSTPTPHHIDVVKVFTVRAL